MGPVVMPKHKSMKISSPIFFYFLVFSPRAGQASGESSTTKKTAADKQKLPEYYDNTYFDSDSDEEGTSAGTFGLFNVTEK